MPHEGNGPMTTTAFLIVFEKLAEAERELAAQGVEVTLSITDPELAQIEELSRFAAASEEEPAPTFSMA